MRSNKYPSSFLCGFVANRELFSLYVCRVVCIFHIIGLLFMSGNCIYITQQTQAPANRNARSKHAVATMIGCLPTQALAVFIYATQAIAFEWKPGLRA